MGNEMLARCMYYRIAVRRRINQKKKKICECISEMRRWQNYSVRTWRDSGVVRHNGKKLLLVDLPILVEIEFLYHGLPVASVRRYECAARLRSSQFVVLQTIADFLRHPP